MYRFVCKWLLLCCVVSFSLNASGEEKSNYSKTIIKEFPIANHGLIEIEHRHGDIQFQSWSEQAVRFEVRIMVHAKDENRAREMFEYLSCEFANSKDIVKATSRIDNQLFKKRNNVSFTIDLLVYRPTDSKVSVTVSHGDVFLKNMEQPLYAAVKHGNITIESLLAESEIHLGYGHCKIDNAEKLLSTLKYGKLKINNVHRLNLESKHSKIYVDHANEIKSVSRYDNFYLGDIDLLSNQGKHDNFKIDAVSRIQTASRYSDFIVQNLTTSGRFEVSYSDVHIYGVGNGLEKISGQGRHSDFVVKAEGLANYSLTAQGEHSSIKTPSSFKINSKVAENHRIKIKGRKGNNGGAKVMMDLVHSSCKILE